MKWKDVIISELRDCDDEEYAAQLLRLLEHERAGSAALSVLSFRLWPFFVIFALMVLEPAEILHLPLLLHVLMLILILGFGGLFVTCARMRWPNWVRLARHFPFPFIGGLRPRWDFRPLQLETALRQACDLRLPGWEQWQALLQRLEQARCDQVPTAEALKMLGSDGWEERFLARHLLADIGGEAITGLLAMTRSPVHSNAAVAYRVLRAISTNSLALSLANEEWHCPEHLLRLSPCSALAKHPQDTSDESYREAWVLTRFDGLITMHFLGCPVCYKSRNLVGSLVAVLDNQDQEERRQAGDGELRVNWLVRGELFDFERVEIVQATDEQVASFILAVGNDADEERGPQFYRLMECSVFEACHLSENTLRALRSVFREVRMVPALGGAAFLVGREDDTKQPATEEETA